MIEAKDRIRQSKAELLDALAHAGADVSRPNAIRCPFHDDRHASAGVYEDEQGVWRFKCLTLSCGLNFDVFDVRERVTGESVESQLAAIRKADAPPPAKPKRTFADLDKLAASYADVVAVYRYTNLTSGNIDLVKIRMERNGDKTFRQAHQRADGLFVDGAPARPHPIYNRTRIAATDQVIVVEGEKCVHAVTDAGSVATCAPGGGGSGSAAGCDWSPLAGKTCVLWPDHDPADGEGNRVGHTHMREVAAQLKQLSPPCSIWWLNPDALKLGDKEDAYDYLARFDDGGRADALSDAIDLAVPMGASSELRDFVNDVVAGRWQSVAFPFAALTKLSKALMPGTITTLVGDPGGTKSMFVVQCLWHWHRQGIPIAAYMLEDDRRFHMLRILAQIDENQNLTDDDWMREYPAEVDAAMARHADELDAIGKFIHDAPDDAPTHDHVEAWLRRNAEAGARVLVVDPITAIDGGDKSFDKDKKFMAHAKSILRRSGASLLQVTHPRNANHKGQADDAAGGRAYGRFSQTMFWLKRFDPSARCQVQDFVTRLTKNGEADRAIVLTKTRNGRGQGLSLAYCFDKRSICFGELGVLLKVEKNRGGDE